MSTLPLPLPSVTPVPGFRHILCAVDGSRESGDGVREAVALATLGTRITFLAITDVQGVGVNRIASLGEHRAEQALAAASALARDHRMSARTELVHDADIVGAVLGRQHDHDLLVVGARRDATVDHGALAGAATALAGRTDGPLLIARRGATLQSSVQRIVVAARRGEPSAAAVARLGEQLAATDGSLIHPIQLSGGEQGRASQILLLAERISADVIVVGRDCRTATGTTGGVNARLVAVAPCSVLVVPA
ncbi:MAG TPA: universal stress protein [Solirubrobacteraceae bacterium]|nr:universal stress protein [Solirubrobacteraceae bacterium]